MPIEKPESEDVFTIARAVSAKLDRVSAIDGLRGLAALAVLLYHARGLLFAGLKKTYQLYGYRPSFNGWFAYLTAPIGFGWLGVILFFVLSGYCIHRRGARALTRGEDVDFKIFARRRFWRIYPTYFVALLVTALVDWYFTARLGEQFPAQDDSPYAFAVSLFSLQGYLAPFFGSNGVFWTLAMEIHLYLAYPILFLFSKKCGPRITLLFTLAVGLAYLALDAAFHFERHMPYRGERGPVFLPYWFVWTVGFYLAEIEAGRATAPAKAFLCTMMVITALVATALHLHGEIVLASLIFGPFFGGVLYFSLSPAGTKLWNLRPGKILSALGVFSYSLYAFHALMLHVFQSMISSSQEAAVSPGPMLAGTAFALVTCWLFFMGVERWSIGKPRMVAPLKPAL